jgi:hypothetical protein
MKTNRVTAPDRQAVDRYDVSLAERTDDLKVFFGEPGMSLPAMGFGLCFRFVRAPPGAGAARRTEQA